MNQKLEKILASITLLSTLFFNGCEKISNLASSKDTESVIQYAEKSANQMREGYYSVENFKFEYRNLANVYEVVEDTIYKKLIFTNTQEATDEVLSSLNGLYQSEHFSNNEAMILKDGNIYEAYFDGNILEGRLKKLKKSKILPPVVILDNDKLLINYNYLARPMNNKPYSVYSPVIIEKEGENIFFNEISLKDWGYNLKNSYELFDRLKDNSFLQVGVRGRHWSPRNKENLLVSNKKAYEIFAPRLEK